MFGKILRDFKNKNLNTSGHPSRYNCFSKTGQKRVLSEILSWKVYAKRHYHLIGLAVDHDGCCWVEETLYEFTHSLRLKVSEPDVRTYLVEKVIGRICHANWRK